MIFFYYFALCFFARKKKGSFPAKTPVLFPSFSPCAFCAKKRKIRYLVLTLPAQ